MLLFFFNLFLFSKSIQQKIQVQITSEWALKFLGTQSKEWHILSTIRKEHTEIEIRFCSMNDHFLDVIQVT